jgi:paraquat-inducible protein B
MTTHENAAPKAVIRGPSPLRGLIWLIPLGAAVAASFFVRDQLEASGPMIAIRFADAAGIRSGDSLVLHRGIAVGKVVGVALSPDKGAALIEVRLRRDQAEFAAEGAAFWIVSPEVSEIGFGGLNTLFSGPYIEALPGAGKPAAEFEGLKKRPVEDGLRLVLLAPRVKSVWPGAPVTFRGIRVGVVREIQLSGDADRVELQVVVWKRYSALVRERSRFWSASPVDVKGGLLSGVEVKLESVRDLVSGEVAFATPDKDMGAPARDGARFALEDQAQKAWLRWAPRIRVSPAGMSSSAEESPFPTGKDLMDSKLK